MAVKTIAILGDKVRCEETVRRIMPLGVVVWFHRTGDLLARVSTGDVDAVVTGLDDASGHSIAPMLVAIAARHPRLPVILHDRVNGGTLHKLLSVFTPGLRMTCAVRPHQDLKPVLEGVLGPWFAPPVAPVLLQYFVARAPAPLRLFVALSALASSTRHSVAAVAQWNCVGSRTIERRLHRAGWPVSRIVLQSFVALDVVWLMTQYGWSARHVQEVRGFSHPSAVTRLLARYAGVRPATLREDGGFGAAFDHVVEALLGRGDCLQTGGAAKSLRAHDDHECR